MLYLTLLAWLAVAIAKPVDNVRQCPLLDDAFEHAPPPPAPATAGTILSFASVVAGFVISYAGLMSDFSAYFTPDVSRYAHASVLLPDE